MGTSASALVIAAGLVATVAAPRARMRGPVSPRQAAASPPASGNGLSATALLDAEGAECVLVGADGEPALLDAEGAECVLVGADDDPERELGIDVLPTAA